MDYFNNEFEVSEIGNLSIENRLDRISVHGDLDITLDNEGLLKARALHEMFRGIVMTLAYKVNTPADTPAIAEVSDVDNPFKGCCSRKTRARRPRWIRP